MSPLEDPYKAFGEVSTTEKIQQQPHVTIVMTVTPSGEALNNYGGEIPVLTLQTTVSTRIYNEVKSFQGQEACT